MDLRGGRAGLPAVHRDRRPDPAAGYTVLRPGRHGRPQREVGGPPPSFSPERGQILELCRVPVSVAELAAILGLPLGVVRVLLGDLLYENLIEVMESAPRGGVVTDQRLLGRVLERLRAL